MSHLSDVQEGLEYIFHIDQRIEIDNKLNFVKWLIIKLEGNLNQDIDPDKMYEEFRKR
jgi:hypothetical protein